MVALRSSSGRSSLTSQLFIRVLTENSRSSLVMESQNCATSQHRVVRADRAPITHLINHHDCQEIASRREEQAVNVVADRCAKRRAEGVEDDLTNDEEKDAKGDVAERPPVLQGPDDEKDLQRDVDHQLHAVEEIQNDEKPDRVRRAKSSPRLESGQRDKEGDDEGGTGAKPHHPERQWCSVLVQLEADETVDHQAGHQAGRQATLYCDEIRVGGRAGRDDAGIDAEREESEKHVEVEEGGDLLPA
jgi:hypothetical protein